MKTRLFLVALMTALSFATFAQNTDKELSKEIKEKAIRNARKDSKRLASEGWQVNPGSLPLDKITEDAWKKQLMTTDNGQQQYLTADGNAVAETKTAAEVQAVEMAKLQLAGLIQTNISSLISANIGNSQLNTKDAASVTEIVQSAKNIIATELGYVNPLYKIFRDVKGTKNVEVQVKLFYDTTKAMEIAKKVIRGELKDKLKLNEEKLDKLMGI